jgi:hypothetical protein
MSLGRLATVAGRISLLLAVINGGCGAAKSRNKPRWTPPPFEDRCVLPPPIDCAGMHDLPGLLSIPDPPLRCIQILPAPGQQLELYVVGSGRPDVKAFEQAGFVVEFGSGFGDKLPTTIRFRKGEFIGDLWFNSGLCVHRTLRLQRTLPDGKPIPWTGADSTIGNSKLKAGAQCPDAAKVNGQCTCPTDVFNVALPDYCEYRVFSDDPRFPPENQPRWDRGEGMPPGYDKHKYDDWIIESGKP